MTLGALGIVYGDIGTSPLYALRMCFYESHGIAVSTDNVLGVLSLIIWSLILVVTLKYIMFVMQADNEGEGGILALMALSERQRPPRIHGRLGIVVILGLIGAAFLYGDGIITPAISVLSAVEGLEIATPLFSPYVIPITVVILSLLFYMQHRGVAKVGKLFGPIMLLWFSTIALLGVMSIGQTPHVLFALNPASGIRFLVHNAAEAFSVLGGVFLVLTGAEALYADMGPCGKRPIQVGWFAIVLPALLLQYLGQGALLIRDPTAIANPFYLLAPQTLLYPMVLLSMAATVIASQAMITGAFSLTHQAVQLGYLPFLRIQHTSAQHIGQIFVPAMNQALLVGTIGLVLLFGASSHLAAAYGIAVSITMLITTLLVYRVARYVWHWNFLVTTCVMALFLSVDAVFFSANILKIPHGGWMPLVLGLAIVTLMTTWHRGRALVSGYLQSAAPPLAEFLKTVTPGIARVPGYGVFLVQHPGATPLALAQNVRHNKVLHEHLIFLTVVTEAVPHLPQQQRCELKPIAKDAQQIIAHYGFMDTPDVPDVLAHCRKAGLVIPLTETTFFLSRLTFLATPKPGMALWREKMFVFLSRNSQRASSFFHLPSEQVVEIGLVLEI
ncbi:MAG: potassium transporter Kup [Nitrospira sp.]|nr:potassium transporter Kup [Nitrospira sp.]